MEETFKVKNHYSVELLDDDKVFLFSEHGPRVLRGQLSANIMQSLRTPKTFSELLEDLENSASLLELQFCLEHLKNEGYIVAEEDDMPLESQVFWDLNNISYMEAKQALVRRTVSIRCFGDVTPEPLISALESVNVRIEDDGENVVVLTDDYLRSGIDVINKAAIASGKSWFIANPFGVNLWVGPIFKPGESGCWHCLASRLQTNREVDDFLIRQKGILEPFKTSFKTIPTLTNTAANLIATEILKWLVRGNESLHNTVKLIDTLNLGIKDHVLVKRPQCPICGDMPYRPSTPPQPITFKSNVKRFITDGGHRTEHPERSWERYKHHVSNVTGVVSHMQPHLEVDSVFHIQGAMYSFSLNHDNWESARRGMRWRGGGKGVSIAQAKASAIGESLERYSGILQDCDQRIYATFKELGDSAIHPHDCLLFSDTQYANREIDIAHKYRHYIIPVPFNESAPTHWSALWSLTENRHRYLPTAYCYYNYWPSSFDDNAFCWADSNGCASGNTYEEAFLQGFMELAERDAVSIWWYNRLNLSKVDLASFDLPFYASLMQYMDSLQREIWVLDISNDLGVPVFVAISKRRDPENEQISIGFGAHVDPKIGISRAITEMAELLATINEFDASKQIKDFDPVMREWFVSANVREQSYLLPAEDKPTKQQKDYSYPGHIDLLDDVNDCLTLCNKRGLDVLVLDQTRPDIGMKVLRIAVPGLRHFWARNAPGRLYDVPVEMGWRERPVKEQDLNPIPVFF